MEGVADEGDAGLEGDGLGRYSVRIATAVPALVRGANQRGKRARR